MRRLPTGRRLMAPRSHPTVRRVLGLLALVLAATSVLMSPARADLSDDGGLGDTPGTAGMVTVVQVNGLIDPIVLSFLDRSLEASQQAGDVAFVIQLNTPAVVVSEDRFERTLEAIAASPVPVAVWVGQSGASAGGDSAKLLAVASDAALAPGSRVEDGGQRIGAEEAYNRGLTSIPATCERERGSDEGCAATVGDLIVSLDSVPVRESEQEDGQVRRVPDVQVRFAQLELVDQLAHTVASPPVAYLFFVIGMALLLFELFTAGIGVAGVVGALMFLGGTYGLGILPTRPWAIALLVIAFIGYGIDIQTGVPQTWTAIATVAFVVGSIWLYDGVGLSWITLLVAVVGIVIAMLAGMPAMVRTRFATPTIGREWMVGEVGEATTAVDPEGVVLVRGAPWRARTNRATPIAAGDSVKVASIEGLIVEVEPVEGAAKDYRRR